MKISIRLSILSILLLLLCGVSIFIIGVNYYNLNTIFIASSKNYLSQACGKTSMQISLYLNPLRRTQISSELINNHNIVPEYSQEFLSFMHIVVNAPSLYSAEWGDVYGNYYNIKKIANEKFLSDIITKSEFKTTKITNTYDSKMVVIDSQKSTTEYDPRLRPWFQIAKYKKKTSWFIYPILNIDTNTTEIGIAASTPIYDSIGNLRGIFSLDMPLTTIINYVKTIKITKNSTIFVVDEVGSIISAFSSNLNLVDSFKMPKIGDINLPWITEAFNLYLTKQQPAFEFVYNRDKYIAAFSEIYATESEHKWFVAVVTPLSDIIAPLQHNTLISLLVALGGILVGIFLSTIFASSVSKPVNTLAINSDLICQLKLDQIHSIDSHIKEVARMASSFNKMKNALQSFQRYMPINLVKNLVSTGKVAEVGGEIKELTIAFTDIENFTPLSESMLPKDLTIYLSEYLQIIAKVVLNNYGTVDKYLGDGSMLFWGAPIDDPHHALHACQTILQLREALAQLNLKWRSENKPEINTRIGINTGPAVVGNVGSDDRLSYTVIGDSVNLTSRLEGLNKLYGTYTILSEFTYNSVKNHFYCRLLDKVTVKGKKQALYIYELLKTRTSSPDTALETYNNNFASAFSCYEKGEWDKACAIFSQMAQQHPNDMLLEIFTKRCHEFKNRPPENWTGAWTIGEK